MTAITRPNLPIPPGAEADEWMIPTDFPEDVVRYLTWSNHDTAKVGVAIDGMQFGDGHLERSISLYNRSAVYDFALTAVEARQLAARAVRGSQCAGAD